MPRKWISLRFLAFALIKKSERSLEKETFDMKRREFNKLCEKQCFPEHVCVLVCVLGCACACV